MRAHEYIDTFKLGLAKSENSSPISHSPLQGTGSPFNFPCMSKNMGRSHYTPYAEQQQSGGTAGKLSLSLMV